LAQATWLKADYFGVHPKGATLLPTVNIVAWTFLVQSPQGAHVLDEIDASMHPVHKPRDA